MRATLLLPGRLAAALLLSAGLAAPASADEPLRVQPVSGFEVERYLGLWH